MSGFAARLPALDRRLGVATIVFLTLALGACSAGDSAAEPASTDASSESAPAGGDATSSTAATASADEVSASREVEYDGGLMRVDVAPVKRAGELARLTVTLTSLRNPAGEENWSFYTFFAPTNTTASDIQLVDLVGAKRYLVATDSEGDCLCTTKINQMFLTEGDSARIEATFSAPPSDVKKIDVVLPGVAGTITDVAVS